MLELAMTEIRDLGIARGVGLEDTVVHRTMGFVDELPATATASLQRDIAAGKPSELEAWSGAVVRLGRVAGVPTPVHDFIYTSLLPRETAARQAAKTSS
jgi:2-dehydropantoate 2-reductase